MRGRQQHFPLRMPPLTSRNMHRALLKFVRCSLAVGRCYGMLICCMMSSALFMSCSDSSERLLEGVNSGRVEVVRDALRAGAAPDRIFVQVSGIVSGEPATRRYAALHEAAQRGDLAIINELLDYSADPDIKDGLHQTPLMRAARYGRSGAALRLIRVSSRFDAEDSMQRTALDWAAGYGDVSTLLAVLIGRPESDRPWSPSHLLSAQVMSGFRNDYERHFVRALLLEYAVDSGMRLRRAVASRRWGNDPASVDASDRHGIANAWTSLMWNASSLGSDASYEMEVSRAMEGICDASGEGWTALHSAVESGSVVRVRTLIERGAIVDAADDLGLTPLMLACLLGNGAVETALRQSGASEVLRDAFGRTPGDFARSLGARHRQQ